MLGISFAVLNAKLVPFHFYFGEANVPLSVLLVLAVVVGAILGLFAGLGVSIKAKRAASATRKQLLQAQKELANLRKLPVKE